MATSCLNEVEDLVTCPVCLVEYDEQDNAKKPKLLSCSHSVCFECLEGMQSSTRDTCPLCRKKVIDWDEDDIINRIPNNTYILCMIKMKALMNPTVYETGKRVPNMCMTCGFIGKRNCCQSTTLKINFNTLFNIEHMMALLDSATKMKAPIRSNLESIIQNQQHLQLYVNEVLESLNAFEQEVRALGEENDSMIREVSSLVDQNPFMAETGEGGTVNTFFTQLFSLADPSDNDGENLEALSHKMERNLDALQSQLNSYRSKPLFGLASETLNTKNDATPESLPVVPMSLASALKTEIWKYWPTSSTSTLSKLQKHLSELTKAISSIQSPRNENIPNTYYEEDDQLFDPAPPDTHFPNILGRGQSNSSDDESFSALFGDQCTLKILGFT